LPKVSYAEFFKNLAMGINIQLNCATEDWMNVKADLIIYTGRVDQLLDYKFGELAYRTLEIVQQRFPIQKDWIVTDCTNKHKYTRTTDHSHFNNEIKGLSLITYEYPNECICNDIPYYPMCWGENRKKYYKYLTLLNENPSIILCGRTALYLYLNMDETILTTMDGIKQYL